MLNSGLAVTIAHDDPNWATNSREYRWGGFTDGKGHKS
jgi:hypothetical protein